MRFYIFLLTIITVSCSTPTIEEVPIEVSNTVIANAEYNPGSFLWFAKPAQKWEEALPVGNGRLGAMVYGRVDTEIIQLNEDTYWSGGPYSTVVEGGHEKLSEIQQLIFEGKPIEAHKLFGRYTMGYPVEQQKYQSLANLHLFFPEEFPDSITSENKYSRWLDLATGVAGVSFEVDGVEYKREVLSSAPDQTVAIRLTASEPGKITFDAELRGERNNAHSNYATDYFRMDGSGDDLLLLTGKSADYLGIEGKLSYDARLKVTQDGGTRTRNDAKIYISDANSVTMYFVAATNFVNYQDVSADQNKRSDDYMAHAGELKYKEVFQAATSDHGQWFNRVNLTLPTTPTSYLPTDERMESIQKVPDPAMAGLSYQFGRYLLIASSRVGTQPTNLQGIWNKDMNPSWDSKYTTNINTEMNYWLAESANLPELTEPLFKMITELTDQGSQVAKEHYGADGWVFHQNTDIWRVAAPMDGPTWGTFTVGGAWLTTHIWEHYLYSMDDEFLKEIYPVMKGSVDFFMDFLVKHPTKDWLVTNPSNSPENPPDGPGYEYFYDEVTAMYYFTTITYGATMDTQILKDLFSYYISATEILGVDQSYGEEVAKVLAKLPPSQVGKDGTLQEWSEDFGQLEEKHRHFSHMYGLYPGNVLSAKRTPELVDPIKAVLEQREDGGTGFSRAWKMALWARLYDGDRANKIYKGYLKEQCYPSLFAKCFTPLQVDGAMGMTAAISEMLVQSHEGTIDLLPALPSVWSTGSFDGVRVRGGFEMDMAWESGALTAVTIKSTSGSWCKIGESVTRITSNGQDVEMETVDGAVVFQTEAGSVYELTF